MVQAGKQKQCVFAAAVDRGSAYKIGGVQAWWYHRERRAINTSVHKFCELLLGEDGHFIRRQVVLGR